MLVATTTKENFGILYPYFTTNKPAEKLQANDLRYFG
jgi:hypothetical protein